MVLYSVYLLVDYIVQFSICLCGKLPGSCDGAGVNGRKKLFFVRSEKNDKKTAVFGKTVDFFLIQ